MAGGTPNNKVSTEKFYEALLKQNDRMDDMERRIVGRLDTITDCLPALENQVETNKDEIVNLRNNSNTKDWGLLLTSVVGNVIAAVIGSRQ